MNMPITDAEYKALEDIVGSEYITRDPSDLEAYCQCWGQVGAYGDKWSPTPAAVALPANTEEIQALVRVCNRLDIHFKPIASGFENVCFAQFDDRGLLLDLKRMNKIIEIDVKNQHAIVEPYVSSWRLQREAMKYGLTVGSIGVGPSGNVIAGACCHFGAGNCNVSMGGLGRNVLGVEWVMPEGTVYTMGSGEMGEDWFSADGPGPSMRGVLRGRAGANGGHGVITKASVKLYPWYGPDKVTFTGDPNKGVRMKGVDPVPENYKVWLVDCQSRESQFKHLLEFGQADVAQMLCGAMIMPKTEGNDESVVMMDMATKMGLDFSRLSDEAVVMITAAETKRGMEFRNKLVEHMIEKDELVNQPIDAHEAFAALMWNFGYPIEAFRSSGDFLISPTTEGSPEKLMHMRVHADEIILKQMAKNRMKHVEVSEPFLVCNENGMAGFHMENCTGWDPYDEDSVKAYQEVAGEAQNVDSDFVHLGIPHLGAGLQIEWVHHVHETWGSYYNNYDYWLREIKHAIDPNNAAEWSAYIPYRYDPKYHERVFWKGEWLDQERERA